MRRCKYFLNEPDKRAEKYTDGKWLAWTRDTEGYPCGILEGKDGEVYYVYAENIIFTDKIMFRRIAKFVNLLL